MTIASGINRIDDLVAENTLRLATKWGVKRYRMNYFRYEWINPWLLKERPWAMAKDGQPSIMSWEFKPCIKIMQGPDIGGNHVGFGEPS